MARSADLGWAWKGEDSKPRAKRKKKKKQKARKFNYRSKRWRALRQRVLNTYGYRCMLCGSVDGSMHVDHIQPVSKAWHLRWKFENLQVLCHDCNMEKSNIHAEDYREDSVAKTLDRETALEAMNRI